MTEFERFIGLIIALGDLFVMRLLGHSETQWFFLGMIARASNPILERVRPAFPSCPAQGSDDDLWHWRVAENLFWARTIFGGSPRKQIHLLHHMKAHLANLRDAVPRKKKTGCETKA